MLYTLIPDAPLYLNNKPGLFSVDTAPTYIFCITRDTLQKLGPARLNRDQTIPIQAYNHHIDSIDIRVGNHPANSVLVVQEIAYPGWIVSVDGTPRRLESVGERLAVVLPDKPTGETTFVTFAYDPPLFKLGALITVSTALITALALLRVDAHIPTKYRRRLQLIPRKARRKAIYMLTAPEFLTRVSTWVERDEIKAESPARNEERSPEVDKTSGNE